MTCYRHPDREAFVSCQRCDRFICPACQVESSVGFLCPDCAGGTQSKVTRQRLRTSRGGTQITFALIAINVLVWLIEVSPFGVNFLQHFVLVPALVAQEPWTMITSGFAHDWNSPLHLLLNMYSLYIFGQAVEPLIGRARFVALYMTAILAGAVGVMWFGGPTSMTVGASGAIFGLMGAYLVFLRTLGQPSGQMIGLIGINLVFGFMSTGISWQGHVGGLLGGLAIAALYANTRNRSQIALQQLGILGIVAALIALTVIRVLQLSL